MSELVPVRPNTEVRDGVEETDHPSVLLIGRLPEYHPNALHELRTPPEMEALLSFQGMATGGGYLGIILNGIRHGVLTLNSTVDTTHEWKAVTFKSYRVGIMEYPIIALQSEEYPSKWITGHRSDGTVDGQPSPFSGNVPGNMSHWKQIPYASKFHDTPKTKDWSLLQYWGGDADVNRLFLVIDCRHGDCNRLQFSLSSSADVVKKNGGFYITSQIP